MTEENLSTEKQFSIYDIIELAEEIIENNEERDFECGGASYQFKYSEENNTIEFHKSVTQRTGEYYSDGGIDTKTHSYMLFGIRASLVDYCNMAIYCGRYGYHKTIGFEFERVGF